MTTANDLEERLIEFAVRIINVVEAYQTQKRRII
jgi:hypothetical protein